MALDAVAAMTAGVARIHRDPISDADPRHVFTHFDDGSGHLVAEDHRLLEANRAKAAVLVIVEVGPADPASGQTHLDLAWARWVGRRHVFDPEVEWSMNDD
jgi:hypothetical protein